jgi:hypothetical protein
MNRYISPDKVPAPALQSTRLLDQVRERIWYLHYSRQTEKAYLHWARVFIRWHGRGGKVQHPRDMGKAEVEVCPTMLADERPSFSLLTGAGPAMASAHRPPAGAHAGCTDNSGVQVCPDLEGRR